MEAFPEGSEAVRNVPAPARTRGEHLSPPSPHTHMNLGTLESPDRRVQTADGAPVSLLLAAPQSRGTPALSLAGASTLSGQLKGRGWTWLFSFLPPPIFSCHNLMLF